VLTNQEQTDPYQLYNLYDIQGARVYDWDSQRLQQRLDTLLLTLKRCSGKVCTRPWEYLHPQGNVDNLRDAMASCFDAFYEAQPKVSFSGCALGQLLEFEGPLGPDVYAEGEI
jgi:N-acetylglucosamine-6-sulfatase